MLPVLSGSSQTPLISSSAPLEGFSVRNINMNGVGPTLKTSQQLSSSACFHPPIATAGLTNLQTWENNTRLKLNPSPPSNPAAEISSNSMPPPPPSTKLNLPPCTTNSTGSSSSMTYGSYPPSSSHSGSEEEQQEQQQEQKKNVIDERKQKRMLSNRESARRSRMRKQQHMDELRAQVVQLRAENNHILSKFNIASQHYLQVEEQNRVLRSQAIDLYQKLQVLISMQQQQQQQQQQQSLGNFDNLEFQNSGFC